MEILLANLSRKVRREKLHGREHLVAPLTLIVPGVLDGSKGPLYYPPEEVLRDPSVWNHIPIVVNHPSENGKPTSARKSNVLNDYGIGILLNAGGKDKLTAEGWFDIEKTQKIDERIFEAIEASRPIELSTGLFTTNEPAPAGSEFKGRAYDFIARNHKPDHLAVLPDSVGACSVQDGCGVLVNEKTLITLEGNQSLLFNQPSHESLRQTLNTLLDQRFGTNTFVVEVFNNFLIYELDNKFFRIGYSVDLRSDNPSKIKLSNDSPVEVIRVVQYKPVRNIKNEKENSMSLSEKKKKELVDSLIGNECCWEENDRETLEGLTDNTLAGLVKQADEAKTTELVANAARKGFEDAEGNTHKFDAEKAEWESKMKEKEPTEPIKNEKDPPKKDPEKKPQTAQEWIDAAPAEIQSAVQNAMDIENREKVSLVTTLTANLEDDAKEAFGKSLLQKPLTELRELMQLLPKQEQQEPSTTLNFAGASIPASGKKQEPKSRGEGIPAPVINWNDKT